MKSVYHKKSWRTNAVQIHVDPPPIPLIKSKNDSKAEHDSVKIKLSRDTTSERLYTYEFKTDLFENGKPE